MVLCLCHCCTPLQPFCCNPGHPSDPHSLAGLPRDSHPGAIEAPGGEGGGLLWMVKILKLVPLVLHSSIVVFNLFEWIMDISD